MTKDEFGTFEIILPAVNGQSAIPHDSKIKVGGGMLWVRALADKSRSPW